MGIFSSDGRAADLAGGSSVTVQSGSEKVDAAECGQLVGGPIEIYASRVEQLEAVHFVGHFAIVP